MPVQGVAGRRGDLAQRLLEPVILERLDLAAVVADEVVVVLAAGNRRLEARDAVSDLDPLDDAELREHVEGAVDAREPD